MPLFLDVGFHYIKPAHRDICWGWGDRKEREGGFKQRGEKKPSEIQNKWFLIHREAGNTAHTQTETLLHGRQASWWLPALLLQQETPPPRSAALDCRRQPPVFFLLCFPRRSYRLVVAGTRLQSSWNEKHLGDAASFNSLNKYLLEFKGLTANKISQKKKKKKFPVG